MLNFDAKKLNKAIEQDEAALHGENEELFDLSKKLSQTRLVNSENLEVDTFFAETLKEKLYYDWAQGQSNGPLPKKGMPTLKFIGATCFTLAIIALVAYFGLFANFENTTTPIMSQNDAVEETTPTITDTSLSAELAFLLGDVEVWEIDGWIMAQPGLVLGDERQIRTGENSKAILKFEDGSAMRIDENTHIILESANKSEIILQQIIGKSYSRVNKSSVLAYTVRSHNTETMAMGTAFTIEVTPNQSLKIKALESDIKLSLVDADTQIEQQVHEGEEAFINYTESNVLPPIVNQINTTDLGGEFIAWNRQQDIEENHPLGRLDDIEPPLLVITNPSNGIVTEDETITIIGESESGAFVSINNETADNLDGKFFKDFTLNFGDNIFEIMTLDNAGNEARAVINVTRKEEEPAHVATANPEPVIEKVTAPIAINEIEPVKEAERYISLNGISNERGVYLTWIVRGIEPHYGFLILKSKSPGVQFPGADSSHFPYSYGRRYFQPLMESGKYYLKICEYHKDGSTGICSNEIQANIK